MLCFLPFLYKKVVKKNAQKAREAQATAVRASKVAKEEASKLEAEVGVPSRSQAEPILLDPIATEPVLLDPSLQPKRSPQQKKRNM